MPEVVRKAFAVAESEKPGATHLELPEDVMARPLDARPLPRHAPVQPEPGSRELQRAADLIDAAENPLALAGNGAIRGHAGRALRAFVHTTGIPVAETFMAKGLIDYEDPKALGTVGLQARDYEMAGFDDADLVIAIGYDLVEHSPEHWNPRGDKTIIVIDSVAAEIDEFFMPDVELIGDIDHVLARLAAACTRSQTTAGTSRAARGRDGRAAATRATTTTSRCARRACCGTSARRSAATTSWSRTSGCTSSGSARMFPAHEPGTVLIANGLAGMGFALPTAIAAKLVHPDRKVVAVSGDGGFLMNAQELETAVRLRHPGRERDLGERASSARSSGSRTRSSGATSASTSATRTSSSWPRRSACPPGAVERRRLPAPAGGRPGQGRPVGDRGPDRLLDRRGDLRTARRRDRRHLIRIVLGCPN